MKASSKETWGMPGNAILEGDELAQKLLFGPSRDLRDVDATTGPNQA